MTIVQHSPLTHCDIIRRELERCRSDCLRKLRGADNSARVSELNKALQSLQEIEHQLRKEPA